MRRWTSYIMIGCLGAVCCALVLYHAIEPSWWMQTSVVPLAANCLCRWKSAGAAWCIGLFGASAWLVMFGCMQACVRYAMGSTARGACLCVMHWCTWAMLISTMSNLLGISIYSAVVPGGSIGLAIVYTAEYWFGNAGAIWLVAVAVAFATCNVPGMERVHTTGVQGLRWCMALAQNMWASLWQWQKCADARMTSRGHSAYHAARTEHHVSNVTMQASVVPTVAPEDECVYVTVVDLTRSVDAISIALLQRRLRLSYQASVRMMGYLETNGIIAPSHGEVLRKVVR